MDQQMNEWWTNFFFLFPKGIVHHHSFTISFPTGSTRTQVKLVSPSQRLARDSRVVNTKSTLQGELGKGVDLVTERQRG